MSMSNHTLLLCFQTESCSTLHGGGSDFLCLFYKTPAGIGSIEKLSRCPDDNTGVKGLVQADKPSRSREEMRELVNTPLPSTWRRSSLPIEEPAVMEELWLRAAGDLPAHRVVQPGVTSWNGQASLPVVKPRRDSRRPSLNSGPLSSHNTKIDVRKNPV